MPVSLGVVDGDDCDGVRRVLVAEGGAGVVVLTHRPEKGPGAGALETVPQVGALALVLTRVAGRLDRSSRCLVALVLAIATGNYVHSLKKRVNKDINGCTSNWLVDFAAPTVFYLLSLKTCSKTPNSQPRACLGAFGAVIKF